MARPEVTILLPNYRTERITKLCLRLLRRHTDPSRVRVLAIDNDSRDESTAYLRSVSWIDLIERPAEPDDTPPLSHSRALDLALAEVDTPFVISLHTDTLVRRGDWLDFLLAEIQRDQSIAGVGSWKLESKPWYKLAAKQCEYLWQKTTWPLRGRTFDQEGEGGQRRYLRSHCALYRSDLIRQYGLGFSTNDDTAGRAMHFALEDAGHQLRFIDSRDLLPYMVHLNHATMILNPELGVRASTITRGHRRIKAILRDLDAGRILADSSLDS